MRIGTLDWSQSFGNSKNTRHSPTEESEVTPSRTVADIGQSMNASSTDNLSPNGVPRPVSGGAPGSAVPGSAVPGTSGGTRTVQWKGKTLNMDTTRNALAQAALEEQRVAQAESDIAQSAANSVLAAEAASTQALHEHIATILTGMNEMCGGLQEIYGTVAKIADRDSNSERVFNTLHAELSDYKKDFIYEHLKPVIRPLLFLYDSLEQFEGEVERFAGDAPATPPVKGSGTIPTRLVSQNTVYFREQLVEALRICEVTPMDTPEGAFNARFQKAVKTVPVEAAQDGLIQHVVRSGWFLNGQLLRSAEVVVGKKVVSG